MPKYIRTEKGIYETSQTVSVNFKECYIEAYDTQLERWVKKDIIKQADTIEELCDEAVAVYPDGSHDNCSVMHIVDNNGFCEAVYGCLSVSADDLKKDYECWEVYGAIWTSKGLIYVAKMNEKGELELIW